MNAQTNEGLAGVTVGDSAIATVGQAGVGLCYRGYSIKDLAEQASFEEVAYLLIYDELPTQMQLQQYQQQLIQYREIPGSLKRVLEQLPANSHPMDVLRTGVSALGCVEQEILPGSTVAIANRLIACMPTMLFYWHQYHRQKNIDICVDELTTAGYLYRLLHKKTPDQEHCRALDVSLILYAEHEFNASTFAARVTASTLADFYSAVVSAIGTLRGPLHGGANEAAMQLIQSYADVKQAEHGIKSKIANKELIMGFGHRVYRNGDPRSPIIKQWAKRVAALHQDTTYIAVAERIETLMREQKNIMPNLDFYSSIVYHFCGMPTVFFTPLFVMSRITGWSAHIMEQRQHNKLIRPLSNYTGPEKRTYIPISQRGE